MPLPQRPERQLQPRTAPVEQRVTKPVDDRDDDSLHLDSVVSAVLKENLVAQEKRASDNYYRDREQNQKLPVSEQLQKQLATLLNNLVACEQQRIAAVQEKRDTAGWESKKHVLQFNIRHISERMPASEVEKIFTKYWNWRLRIQREHASAGKDGTANINSLQTRLQLGETVLRAVGRVVPEQFLRPKIEYRDRELRALETFSSSATDPVTRERTAQLQNDKDFLLSLLPLEPRLKLKEQFEENRAPMLSADAVAPLTADDLAKRSHLKLGHANVLLDNARSASSRARATHQQRHAAVQSRTKQLDALGFAWPFTEKAKQKKKLQEELVQAQQELQRAAKEMIQTELAVVAAEQNEREARAAVARIAEEKQRAQEPEKSVLEKKQATGVAAA